MPHSVLLRCNTNIRQPAETLLRYPPKQKASYLRENSIHKMDPLTFHIAHISVFLDYFKVGHHFIYLVHLLVYLIPHVFISKFNKGKSARHIIQNKLWPSCYIINHKCQVVCVYRAGVRNETEGIPLTGGPHQSAVKPSHTVKSSVMQHQEHVSNSW